MSFDELRPAWTRPRTTTTRNSTSWESELRTGRPEWVQPAEPEVHPHRL